MVSRVGLCCRAVIVAGNNTSRRRVQCIPSVLSSLQERLPVFQMKYNVAKTMFPQCKSVSSIFPVLFVRGQGLKASSGGGQSQV